MTLNYKKFANGTTKADCGQMVTNVSKNSSYDFKKYAYTIIAYIHWYLCTGIFLFIHIYFCNPMHYEQTFKLNKKNLLSIKYIRMHRLQILLSEAITNSSEFFLRRVD